MKRQFAAAVASLVLIGCSTTPDAADFSVKRDLSFTGRGNAGETLLELTVMPEGSCVVKGVNVVLDASASDVSGLSLVLGDEVLSSVRTKSGKTLYRLRCGREMADTVILKVCVDIAQDASEGGFVGAEIASVQMKGSSVVPEAPEAGSREILLCRKRLFAPGDYGSNFYRIPAIRQLQDVTLLVVNDRRNITEEDLPGEIDVVSRYSTDGGRTWSEPTYVAKNQGFMFGYGDPGLAELEDGTVICTFCGGQRLNKSCWEDPQRSYYSISKDHGRTWSEPVNITASIWGPDPANPFCKRYNSSFFSSGNSLVLDRGEHKGRVLVANVTTYNSWYGLCNHAVYTDDGGETWNVSELAYADKGDEAKMVQLLDGWVMMSIRQSGKRAYVISEDGGQTWSEPSFWDDMEVTACNGDLIRYNDEILLHTVPFSMKRENVSVLLSFDEGKTWPERKTICAGPSQYSSITVLQDGTIGAYIEENTSATELWYENFSLDWLRRH